jgi:hypothetical protein
MCQTAFAHALASAMAVVVILAASAVGQPAPPLHQTGPLAGYLPPERSGDVYFEDVKSDPLRNGETFYTTWALHIGGDDSDGRPDGGLHNYAGLLFDLRYDGHELSDLTIWPIGFHKFIEVPSTMGLWDSWVFPGSQSSPQTILPVAAWIRTDFAMQSGITLGYPSSVVSLFGLAGHAKNTFTCNNSDIDITISAWQIVHIAGAQFVQLGPGSWIYVTPGGTDLATVPGAGIWQQLTTWLSTTLAPSAFVATNVNVGNVAGYGIEHVPEPLSLLLLAAGVGMAAVGRARRRSGTA